MTPLTSVFQDNSRTRLHVLSLLQVPFLMAWSDDWSFWQQGYRAFILDQARFAEQVVKFFKEAHNG